MENEEIKLDWKFANKMNFFIPRLFLQYKNKSQQSKTKTFILSVKALHTLVEYEAGGHFQLVLSF